MPHQKKYAILYKITFFLGLSSSEPDEAAFFFLGLAGFLAAAFGLKSTKSSSLASSSLDSFFTFFFGLEMICLRAGASLLNESESKSRIAWSRLLSLLEAGVLVGVLVGVKSESKSS